MTMTETPSKPLHVAVVVMGDVGRSPRMQYHTESLLREGFTVSLIGYQGEQLIPSLQNNDTSRLQVIRFSTSWPKFLKKCLPLYFLWRVCSLVGGLVWALWIALPSRHPVDCLLVQNPPAIPLLAVSIMFCQFQRIFKRHFTALVIDWHNLGYSMLNPGIIRDIAKWYEEAMAPLANGHFCVTQVMKNHITNMSLVKNVQVLYDCPPEMFRPMSLDERHEFLMRIH
jgi:beta-1,4-mannosyltransferase